ncbi:hypothetical protein EJB05_01037 [Eragrostis curvula]|uniref:Uncharacterized protein n=1 Tax=Eragrostis curvula TaxID=38414 RepID=A0A5J9WNL9_9POAL|nr:hypothetical protein EJB05_01037 [Eragrostis curvula]
MSAALLKALRGGRSRASTQLLLPATGRRMPQQEGVAQLLPRPGAAAPASPPAGLLGRLVHTGRPVPPSSLEALKKKYIFIPGPVRYVPYDSEEALLYLAHRFDKLGYKVQRVQTHLKYLAAVGLVIVAVEVGLLIHSFLETEANKKSLEEFETAVEQAGAELKELEVLQSQIEQDLN